LLRRLADRLWTHTLCGRAQAEHQYVLARLKAYCGEDGNASTTLNSAASALAEWAEHRWRWQVAKEHARGSTQADAGRPRLACLAREIQDGHPASGYQAELAMPAIGPRDARECKFSGILARHAPPPGHRLPAPQEHVDRPRPERRVHAHP